MSRFRRPWWTLKLHVAETSTPKLVGSTAAAICGAKNARVIETPGRRPPRACGVCLDELLSRLIAEDEVVEDLMLRIIDIESALSPTVEVIGDETCRRGSVDQYAVDLIVDAVWREGPARRGTTYRSRS